MFVCLHQSAQYIRIHLPAVKHTALESFILYSLYALIQEAKHHHYKIIYKTKQNITKNTSITERCAHFYCDKVYVKQKQQQQKRQQI